MITEMKILIDELNLYTRLYNEGHSLISDEKWDEMYFKLKQWEKDTGIIYPDSPTQTIQFETVSKLEKITHEHPMLSLDKSKNIEDVKSFLHGQPFVGMFKADGLTCSLTYEQGKLVRAETRGNGIVGENILHNARVIRNIPKYIPYTGRLVVDGEIICYKDVFERVSSTFKNPRNYAAGSIRLLDAKTCSARGLSFVAWEMIEGYPKLTQFIDRLDTLRLFGFDVIPAVFNLKSVEEAIEELNNLRDVNYPTFPIDGYVFKFADVEYGNQQGQTSHHLKNAFAYKFYDETYDTKLLKIEWSMGRTGVLTPIAVFEPIDTDESIVERASLHNVSVMREVLGECAYIGEPLKIAKMNMIIPQVIEAGPCMTHDEVIKENKIPLDNVPHVCPICKGRIITQTSNSGVVNAFCENPNCEGKLNNILEHFFGKKGLDVKGLSKMTFNKLIDWKWVNEVKDVFNLKDHRNEWIKKPGFGIASVDKILNSIEEHKKTTLSAFICALGIPLIGQTAARELEKEFKTYEAFRAAVDDSNYYFFSIANFGEEMNDSLKNYDYSAADEIEKILSIQPPVVSNNNIENTLSGKTIVITGKLNKFSSRSKLKEEIVNRGGKVTDAVSSRTDILINNDTESSTAKNKKAKSLGIPILSEAEFVEQFLEK